MAISVLYKTGYFTLLAALILLLASGCSGLKDRKPEVSEDPSGTAWKCAGDMAEEAWRCAGDGEYPSVSEFKPAKPSQPTEEAQLLDENLAPDLELQSSAATPVEIPLPGSTDIPDRSDEAIILNTPGSYFAIQLAALAELSETESFRNQYPLANLLQVRIESNDQLWFVLLAGVYESYVDAKQAEYDLLEDYPDLSSWVRPISGLQKAVERAGMR